MLKPAIIALGMALLFTACPHPMPPTPFPLPDAAVTSDAPSKTDVQSITYQALCDKLYKLHCTEGADPDCIHAFVYNDENGSTVTDLKVGCLNSAQTVDQVRQCGTVECALLPSAQDDKCTAACNNVKRLKCREATSCLEACNKNKSSTVVDMKLDCLAAAKTQVSIRKCGTVACAP